MSTVLPDALLDEPPPALLLLLPLLLQPAATRATAASAAAIAGVRFNIFMIFLSFGWLALRPGSPPTRPDLGFMAVRSPRDLPDPPDLPAPADSTTHTRESGVLGRWRISRSPYRAFVPAVRIFDVLHRHRRIRGRWGWDRRRRPRLVCGTFVSIRPSWHGRACQIPVSRRLTARLRIDQHQDAGDLYFRPGLTPGTGISRHVAGVRVRATMRACDVPSSPARMIGRNDTTTSHATL